MRKLTAKRLRERLNYDRTTGLFEWRVKVKGRKLDQPAGCHDAYGYINICIDQRRYKAHRLAWLYVYGRWPDEDIDHKNGVRDDNRLKNLRDVSRSVNLQNQRKPRGNNGCGFLGAHHHVSGNYTAQIKVDGRKHHLGSFKTPEAAHAAYVTAKKKFHGVVL